MRAGVRSYYMVTIHDAREIHLRVPVRKRDMHMQKQITQNTPIIVVNRDVSPGIRNAIRYHALYGHDNVGGLHTKLLDNKVAKRMLADGFDSVNMEDGSLYIEYAVNPAPRTYKRKLTLGV